MPPRFTHKESFRAFNLPDSISDCWAGRPRPYVLASILGGHTGPPLRADVFYMYCRDTACRVRMVLSNFLRCIRPSLRIKTVFSSLIPT